MVLSEDIDAGLLPLGGEFLPDTPNNEEDKVVSLLKGLGLKVFQASRPPLGVKQEVVLPGLVLCKVQLRLDFIVVLLQDELVYVLSQLQS